MEKYTGTDNWELILEDIEAQCSLQKAVIDGEYSYRVEKDGIVEDFLEYKEAKNAYDEIVKRKHLLREYEEMESTQSYFNKTIDELLVTDEYEYTREEKLIYDEGLEVVFFDDKKEMNEEEVEFIKYLQSRNYTIKSILKTVNERIAVILV